MGIRIQPRDLEVPEEAPFLHDRLDRKTPARVLTQIVASVEGPCVLSIDGPFGAGKSTFLRLWTQHLKNEGFPVAQPWASFRRPNSWSSWTTQCSRSDGAGDLPDELRPSVDADAQATSRGWKPTTGGVRSGHVCPHRSLLTESRFEKIRLDKRRLDVLIFTNVHNRTSQITG